MATIHPNMSVLERLSAVVPHDLANASDLFSDGFVWHYFNPRLPGLAGDYSGLGGLQAFFDGIRTATNGTFRVEGHEIISVGNELVVAHAKPMMTIEEDAVEMDSIGVWRIVGNRIIEAWEIPAVHTMRPQTR